MDSTLWAVVVVVAGGVVVAVVALVLNRNKDTSLDTDLKGGKVKFTAKGTAGGEPEDGVKRMHAKRDIKVRDKGEGAIADFDAGQDIEIDRTSGGDRPKA
jgi:hypothetical protein